MNKILTASLFAGLLALSHPTFAQSPANSSQAKNPPSSQPAKASATNTAPSAVVTSININTATAEQLTQLSGIGTAKAAAIIAYREQHGPFKSVEELTKVSGIGAATVEKNRHLLSY